VDDSGELRFVHDDDYVYVYGPDRADREGIVRASSG
jgi:hypothetical protein